MDLGSAGKIIFDLFSLRWETSQIFCISSSHHQVLALKLRRVVLMLYERAEPNGFEAEFSALKLHAS